MRAYSVPPLWILVNSIITDCEQICSLFLLYRKLRSYTIKILSYCRAKFFEKQKIAFQKCTWLKKSEFAPRFRRRRCGEAAFLVLTSALFVGHPNIYYRANMYKLKVCQVILLMRQPLDFYANMLITKRITVRMTYVINPAFFESVLSG